MMPLPYSFYDHSTLIVARRLIGKVLVRRRGRQQWSGRIVEVEAYIGEQDPACHAFRGLTPRTRVMYGPPGHAYVYFTYGMHFMLNVVTEKEGYPAAVLIRAVEPLAGFNGLHPRPASGPGKLCKVMRIDKQLNGISLQSEKLWIGRDDPSGHKRSEVRWSSRVGISAGSDRLWRAYLFGNPFVSRKSNPEDARSPEPVLLSYD